MKKAGRKMKMTRWKRGIGLALALLLTVSLGAAAYADGEPVEPADESQALSVTLDVQDEAYKADLGEAATMVRVYQVATGDEYGQYELSAGFEALADAAAWNDGMLTGDTKLAELLTAAVDALGPAEPEAPEATPEPEATEPPVEPVEPAAAEPIFEGELALIGGKVDIPARGLYLIVPESPVQTDLWEYTFNPILLPVPGVSEGAWQYAVTVQMKPTRERLLTDIVIEKRLPEYNATLGPTTFIFEVTAQLDGKTVYSNVVSLTFEGPGTQSVTVSDIPVGAHVTVTEVYSGGSYEVVDGSVTVDIPELPLPADGDHNRVPFTNTYTDERIPDGSVVNRYVYNGTGWDYQEEADQ